MTSCSRSAARMRRSWRATPTCRRRSPSGRSRAEGSSSWRGTSIVSAFYGPELRLRCRWWDGGPDAPHPADPARPRARAAARGAGRLRAGDARLRPARGDLPRGGRPRLARRGRARDACRLLRRARAPRGPDGPGCGGARPPPAALGGGWLELAGFCTAAGGVIAFALRIAPAAAALARDLRPSAPRTIFGLALEPALPL